LTGADVADNGLTGADINESTLGIVPNANTLDGLDSARFTNTAATGTSGCLNLTSNVTTCGSATVSGLTAGDDVYVSAWYRWNGTAVGQDTAFCAIKRSTNVLQGGLFGQSGNEHSTNDTSADVTLVGLETNAPAGTSSYLLVCNETDGAMNIVGTRVVAIRLSG
jgi:hypothetical protein